MQSFGLILYNMSLWTFLYQRSMDLCCFFCPKIKLGGENGRGECTDYYYFSKRQECTLTPYSCPEANPWVNAADKYAVGNVVYGRVARMTDFGAFVELEPGVDALLHVSQISREHVEKPADVLRIGQEIEARVVDFNEADHKISLSIKAMMAPAAQDADVADVDIDAMSQYTEE